MRPPQAVRLWWAIALVLGIQLAAGGCGSGDKTTGSSANTTPGTPAGFDFGSNNPLRASAFGDSITVGVLEERIRTGNSVINNLATINNYPNNLQTMLRGLDPDWRVTNRGVGGEQTAAGRRRLPSVLARDKPGFVLVLEGTNDAGAGEDPAVIVGNLEAMVLDAQASKTVPVIGTIPPDFRNDSVAKDAIAKANAMIRTMARARGVVLAEIFDGMNDRSLFGQAPDRDPLHPNERGYVVMAGIWFAAMQRAIPPPPPPTPPPSQTGTTGEPPSDAGQRTKRR